MVLKFFNSLGNKVEEFKSIKEGFVGLYTCGPTVYNFAHIGNLKCYVWEDLLKRYLLFRGFKVKQVMNYTDVDDKTIKGSINEGIPLIEYTQRYKNYFLEDIKKLNILPAEVYCAATDHIPQMVGVVKKLLDKGLAYKGEDGSIYFSIKKFSKYGQLAGIDPTKLKAGARVKQDEYSKEGVGDFALWKAWDENDGPVYWDTILGKGRPGWHIECSAMSMYYLGNQFDIHTGGIDNKFPHHENEIAQSEGVSGKKFVNYWLHTAHLMVNGQKMSKSLGNFFTLNDLIKKGLDPKAIRYTLINSNYRQPLNFTFEGVEDSKKTIQGLQNFIERLFEIKELKKGDGVDLFANNALNDFIEAMDNDLNVPLAMAVVFDFVKKVNKLIDEGVVGLEGANNAILFLKKVDSVIGVLDFSEKFFELNQEQIQLIEERKIAKIEKNWVKADSIRMQLERQGIQLIDNKDGSITAKQLSNH
jgi:cysteinyl-tRNA synthetase